MLRALPTYTQAHHQLPLAALAWLVWVLERDPAQTSTTTELLPQGGRWESLPAREKGFPKVIQLLIFPSIPKTSDSDTESRREGDFKTNRGDAQTDSASSVLWRLSTKPISAQQWLWSPQGKGRDQNGPRLGKKLPILPESPQVMDSVAHVLQGQGGCSPPVPKPQVEKPRRTEATVDLTDFTWLRDLASLASCLHPS